MCNVNFVAGTFLLDFGLYGGALELDSIIILVYIFSRSLSLSDSPTWPTRRLFLMISSIHSPFSPLGTFPSLLCVLRPCHRNREEEEEEEKWVVDGGVAQQTG